MFCRLILDEAQVWDVCHEGCLWKQRRVERPAPQHACSPIRFAVLKSLAAPVQAIRNHRVRMAKACCALQVDSHTSPCCSSIQAVVHLRNLLHLLVKRALMLSTVSMEGGGAVVCVWHADRQQRHGCILAVQVHPL